jgi:hypothetical protein
MAKKVKLTLARSGGHGHPGEVEVDVDRIMANDVVLPWERGGVDLWVVGAEFGPMGAVWAKSIEDALDEIVDQDLGAGILVDQDDVTEEDEEHLAHLGNAGEWADLTSAWAGIVKFDLAQDCKLLCAFAEARGAGADRIDDFIR